MNPLGQSLLFAAILVILTPGLTLFFARVGWALGGVVARWVAPQSGDRHKTDP